MTQDPDPPDDSPASPRSVRKRQAVLAAATEIFLRGGYLGTNMDEIAQLSGVSKQTVYKHFTSKEALFVAVVSEMTNATGDRVHNEPEPAPGQPIADYLEAYAIRQLSAVLQPSVMQLRRLVIGEVGRFPALARTLYERGPGRALAALADIFARLAARGLLTIGDPRLAASHFNWLVMSQAINQAMLLGDEGIPTAAELRHQAREGVRVFLAAYGAAPATPGLHEPAVRQ